MNPSSQQNSKVWIGHDPKSSRFVIMCPSWLVDRVRKIPNRRWDSRRSLWTAPVLRANSDYLLSAFHKDSFDPQAYECAIKSLERRPAAEYQFPYQYRFQTEPRPYQFRALQAAWGKTAFAYHMDMGTGKTKVSLDLFSAYFQDGKIDRLLVVTKFSTRKNWEREIGIHMPHPADVMILNTQKPKVFEEWNTEDTPQLKVLIVGTESLAAGNAILYAEKFVNVSTRVGMVVDEAHMIKNHSAVRAKACVKLGKSASYRVAMTGTPVANGPMDLYMQFEYLDPDILGIGDYYSFRNRYAVMGGFENKEIVGYQNMEELIELVSPFVFQVRKSEVLTELPPKVFETREVQMTEEQRRLYKDIAKRDATTMGDRGITVKSVLERMLRLQEITGGIITFERNPDLFNKAKFEHSRIPGKNPKVEELLAIAEEVEGSVIVWCRFIEEIRAVSTALRERFGDAEVVEIHGAVSETDRDRNVQEIFQQGHARFLVGNAATGGVGLNMTRAETVVYFSNSFSFTDREQSEDRAHRIGQTRSVTYIDLVAEGTVDATVTGALCEKKDVSEFVRTSINEKSPNTLFGQVS
jgi:SNF2 family DNA or RNA helicase